MGKENLKAKNEKKENEPPIYCSTSFEKVGIVGDDIVAAVGNVDSQGFMNMTPAETDEILSLNLGNTGFYLKEIGQTPLLTAEEEVTLSKQYKIAVVLRNGVLEKARGKLVPDEVEELGTNTFEEAVAQLDTHDDDWGETDDLSKEQVRALILQGVDSYNHLVMANTRLVISIAKKTYGGDLHLLDLAQEGNIGLMKAAARFDHTKGNKFSTFATWWIRQTTTRAYKDQGRLIRLPVHVGETVARMVKTKEKLTNADNPDPSPELIAIHLFDEFEQYRDGSEIMTEADRRLLKEKTDRVNDLVQWSSGNLSLDRMPEDGGDEMYEYFSDDGDPAGRDSAVEGSPDAGLRKDDIEGAMLHITPREERAVRLYYGLGTHDVEPGTSMTLEEVGKILGPGKKITRMRARQIIKEAVRKLRGPKPRGELIKWR